MDQSNDKPLSLQVKLADKLSGFYDSTIKKLQDNLSGFMQCLHPFEPSLPSIISTSFYLIIKDRGN